MYLDTVILIEVVNLPSSQFILRFIILSLSNLIPIDPKLSSLRFHAQVPPFLTSLTPISTHYSKAMPRQFFVGGNFKMNPNTRNQKEALVEVLNKAQLDLATGTKHTFPSSHRSLILWCARGGHCSTLNLSDLFERDPEEGHPDRGSELLLQGIRRVHWRDQVRGNFAFIGTSANNSLENSPGQLVDAGIPYVILGEVPVC